MQIANLHQCFEHYCTYPEEPDNAISGGDNLLLSVSYFDEYGRAIRVISDNHPGGKDIVYTSFDFTGNPEMTVSTHNIDGAGEDVKMTSTYKYDHQGRLLSENLKLNNDDEITLVANTYSDTGEPIAKYLHGTADGHNFNQEANFKYNIKGWLKEINQVSSPGKDLFAMALHYEDGTTGCFNGNIWRMNWKNATGDPKRYEFAYDGLNRLRSAGYADGASFDNHTTNYFDTGYTYDANGNLQTLKRYQASNLIDDLVYNYPTGSNQLQSVSDNGTTEVKDLGYKAGAHNYSYDGNGNMVTDHNETVIGYNFMNLPELVTYNTDNKIKYAYTATGIKLQKMMEAPTFGDKVVDYIGPFLYEDSDLKCIFTAMVRICN